MFVHTDGGDEDHAETHCQWTTHVEELVTRRTHGQRRQA